MSSADWRAAVTLEEEGPAPTHHWESDLPAEERGEAEKNHFQLIID